MFERISELCSKPKGRAGFLSNTSSFQRDIESFEMRWFYVQNVSIAKKAETQLRRTEDLLADTQQSMKCQIMNGQCRVNASMFTTSRFAQKC